ncbi:MAG TPA: twin-arginine translocase subunit TatC [Kiritimatiellia bacterium]|nr:twin-arginine translocase subunit TatC [Kiritimatiellia bacterium]HMO98255.1 twin-arginine translocase subunit TatC [Kiritimatiellia bacterium]HMP96600.1 twin-arginine translocase subunit TatC [Kiritimatiellia bacterium]
MNRHPPDTGDDTGLVKPFLDHLEDLRQTLIRAAIALVGGMVIAFPLTPWMLGLLKRPLHLVSEDPDRMLQSMEVAGAFVAAMRMSFWGGLLLSAPVLVFLVGAFILPALREHEKRLAARAGALGVVLFFVGVLTGYFYTLPFALSAMFLFHGWLGVVPLWTISSYVAFSTQLLIAFGLAFEIPVVLLILGRLGIVSGEWLRAHRRHAVVVALILACVLTPPDVVSQIAMTIPLMLMYEGCIWLVLAWDRRKKEADAALPLDVLADEPPRPAPDEESA